MAKPLFEIKIKTGWIKLDDILEKIQNTINERTPLASERIELDELPDGMMICLKDAPGSSMEEQGGSSGSGASVAIYGARDGAPAVFHLLQSSAPTAP